MRSLFESWQQYLNEEEDLDIYTNEERQKAKEEAIQLALQIGCYALSRDGLDMYAIDAEGNKLFITTGKNYDTLWHDALAALREDQNENPI
jgi:hypothetical protein